MTRWGVLTRRERWTLNWRGWLLVFLLSLGILAGVLFKMHPFLAVTKTVQGDFLVMEGWLPDYAQEESLREFQAHNYQRLITTGCPLEVGTYLFEYGDYARLGASTLKKLGLAEDKLQAVPSQVKTRDRTFASALALKKWFQDNSIPVKAINVITLGPHARRTRLLFQKAMGNGISVGIISLEDREYDPRRWWTCSAGVRLVISEAIAYTYARFFFRATAPSQNHS